MAVRKQFFKRSAPNKALNELLEVTKDKSVTEEELAEQRVSFAYGNASDHDYITKESVRASANRTKLLA